MSTPEYVRSEWEGRLRLPRREVPQDAEWCEVQENGSWRRIRFHDYAEIYRRRFLYEHLFYGLLQCRSPQRVARLLGEVWRERGGPEAPLRVLDLGAGSGIVASELAGLRPEFIMGVDLLPEAKEAAARERPDVYDEYMVVDLTQPSPQIETKLAEARLNCLVCVAALGFGDIPPRAYFNAVRHVARDGLIAFNIKEEFLDARYTHGFSELIRRSQAEGCLRFEATRRYRHRFSAAGEPIFYTAIVATKRAELPESVLVEPADSPEPSARGLQRKKPGFDPTQDHLAGNRTDDQGGDPTADLGVALD